MLRNTLSFSFHHATSEIPFVSPLRLPESWVHGELDSLPSKVEYTPGINTHNVVLEGNQGAGTVNVVNATPTYGSDAFHVDLSNVPSRIEVTADWTEERKHVVYDASQVVQEIDVDGFFSGQYFLAEIQDLPDSVEIYANKTDTRFDGSLSASSPLSRVALVSPSGALPPESLPDTPNYVEIVDQRTDGRKEINVDLRDVQGASWDAALPSEGSEDLAVDVSLQRGSPGDLTFLLDGTPYVDARVTGAPSDVGLQFGKDAGQTKIQYTAPGTTQDVTVWVEGLDTTSLDARELESISVNLQGVKDALQLLSLEDNGDNKKEISVDGGTGTAILDSGRVVLDLGEKAPSTGAGGSQGFVLDAVVEAGQIQFLAHVRENAHPADVENFITIRERDDDFAMNVQFTDITRAYYETQERGECESDIINEATLEGSQGNDFLLVMDSRKQSDCSGETEDDQWRVRARGLVNHLTVRELEVNKWNDLVIEEIFVDGGKLDEIRYILGKYGNAAPNMIASLEGFPAGSITRVEFFTSLVGATAKLVVDPSIGTIDAVNWGWVSDGNRGGAIGLRNVDMHVEFDLDMDKRHNRAHFYHDTDGKPLFGSLRVFGDRYGIGLVFGGVVSEDFQFHYRETKLLPWLAPVPTKLSVNGWMKIVPETLNDPIDAEVKIGGRWFPVPDVEGLFLQ